VVHPALIVAGPGQRAPEGLGDITISPPVDASPSALRELLRVAMANIALKQQIKQHNLGSGANACYRTKVGCLRICCHGPTMVVYPEGTWYHGMTAERIPRCVREHLIEGRPVEEWVFARNPLGEGPKEEG